MSALCCLLHVGEESAKGGRVDPSPRIAMRRGGRGHDHSLDDGYDGTNFSVGLAMSTKDVFGDLHPKGQQVDMASSTRCGIFGDLHPRDNKQMTSSGISTRRHLMSIVILDEMLVIQITSSM